jgi:hypothetical protein
LKRDARASSTERTTGIGGGRGSGLAVRLIVFLVLSSLSLVSAAEAAVAPSVTDTWVAKVGTTAVELHGTIDTGEAATNGRFEYLTDAAYQANLTAVPPRDPFAGAVETPVGGKAIAAAAVPVEIKQAVGGLRPGTTYHYRLVASNNEGTDFGPSRTFTLRVGEESLLLDGRAWEMVSPVDKNGGEIQAPGGVFGGGVFQAAAAGGSITYSSLSSFGEGQGSPGASQYISSRGSDGWTTANVTTPTVAGAFGLDLDGVPYQLFSGDLARAVVLDPQRCETAPCPRRYQLRQSSTGVLSPSPATTDLALAGANPNLTQTVLATGTNLYTWSGGALSLINFLPGDSTATPGATLAAQGAGSISDSGSRVYFYLGGNLYLRDGAETVQVDQSAGGEGVFQVAGSDGATAYFLKAEHLYRFTVASGTATDLTPAGGVLGVLGSSTDDAYLYYLTADGLYLRHEGVSTRIADGADASDYPPSVGTTRVDPSGNLVFLSSAALGEVDTGGFPQVYLYRPSAANLTCVSCNPTGARPLGPSSIPGAVANGKSPGATQIYKPRVLSAAGDRLFFESDDALLLTDTNGHRDVYEWEAGGAGSCANPAGCLGLISSGRAEGDASFLDASADGNDALFLTGGSLVEDDPTGADVYDARAGGGFPVPQKPIVCKADACQVVPGEPEDPALGTGFFRTEGNPPVTFPGVKKHCKKKHHCKKKRHGKKRHHRKKGGRR